DGIEPVLAHPAFGPLRRAGERRRARDPGTVPIDELCQPLPSDVGRASRGRGDALGRLVRARDELRRYAGSRRDLGGAAGACRERGGDAARAQQRAHRDVIQAACPRRFTAGTPRQGEWSSPTPAAHGAYPGASRSPSPPLTTNWRTAAAAPSVGQARPIATRWIRKMCRT